MTHYDVLCFKVIHFPQTFSLTTILWKSIENVNEILTMLDDFMCGFEWAGL